MPLNSFDPVTLVRSPILTKRESSPMVRGSRPLSRHRDSCFGTLLGANPSVAVEIAVICEGVVPHHPPTMLIKPSSANSFIIDAVNSGDSSYSPKALGKPAFGWQLIGTSEIPDSSSK